MSPATTYQEKLLLQAMISRRVADAETFAALFYDCMTLRMADEAADGVKSVIAKSCKDAQMSLRKPVDAAIIATALGILNEKLAWLDMEISTLRFCVDGKVYYGFVNTTADEITKHATTMSEPQRALFYAVVQNVLEVSEQLAQDASDIDDPNSAMFQEALKTIYTKGLEYTTVEEIGLSAGGSLALRPSETEAAVHELASKNWLRIIQAGDHIEYIQLGPRAVLEIPEAREWSTKRLLQR